jgi:hypothetical protein
MASADQVFVGDLSHSLKYQLATDCIEKTTMFGHGRPSQLDAAHPRSFICSLLKKISTVFIRLSAHLA